MDTLESQELSPQIYLLPGFDEYLLGYTDRSTVLDAQYAQKVCPGNNGMFSPTVISNGRVVGTWKRTLKKKEALITLTPFNNFSKDERSNLSIAAEHYGSFINLPVLIEF